MFQSGEVVFSAAGHDKERFYAVVGVGEDGCPLIADGKRRKLQSPKRKNPKHLRPTGKRLELAGIGSYRALRRAIAALGLGPVDPEPAE